MGQHHRAGRWGALPDWAQEESLLLGTLHQTCHLCEGEHLSTSCMLLPFAFHTCVPCASPQETGYVCVRVHVID